MIQSILHYLSNMINTDDVAVDRSSRINCKVYRTVLSANVHPNAAKLFSTS